MRLRTLAAVFLRIGNTTFGGGDPTVAALGRELVERRGALDPEQYGIVYGLARITPGTNMLAFCAGAGWMLRGWAGAVIAVTTVAVPPAIVALMLLWLFEAGMANPIATAALNAVIAAAVGLVLAASALLVLPLMRRTGYLRSALLATLSFLLVWKQALSPVEVLALAGLAGFLWREPVQP